MNICRFKYLLSGLSSICKYVHLPNYEYVWNIYIYTYKSIHTHTYIHIYTYIQDAVIKGVGTSAGKAQQQGEQGKAKVLEHHLLPYPIPLIPEA